MEIEGFVFENFHGNFKKIAEELRIRLFQPIIVTWNNFQITNTKQPRLKRDLSRTLKRTADKDRPGNWHN